MAKQSKAAQELKVKETLEEISHEVEKISKKKDKKKKKHKKHKHSRESGGGDVVTIGDSNEVPGEGGGEERIKKKKKKKDKEKKHTRSPRSSQRSDDEGEQSTGNQDIMEINENGEAMAVQEKQAEKETPTEDLIPKRAMKVSDLAAVKIRKYRYHDKFEKK